MGTRWMVLLWLPLPLSTRNRRRESPFARRGRHLQKSKWMAENQFLSIHHFPWGSQFCNFQPHPWLQLLGFQATVLYVTFSLLVKLTENHILLCEKCSILDCQSSIQLEKIYVRHSFIFHVFLCIGWNEKIMKGCILSTFASVWLSALTDLFFKCIYFLH